MEVKIRPLRFTEIPKMLEFRRHYDYRSPLTDGAVKQEVSVIHMLLKHLWYRDRLVTLVADEGGEIVGYTTLVLGKSKKFQGNVYLVSAAVCESMRGRGIGTKLFNEAERYARTRSARRIELDVFARNEGAVKLYERLGYEVEGRKRKAVSSPMGDDDLIFMAKLL